MEIREFRVILRARDFDRTSRFYGEILRLPQLSSWDNERGRGVVYQAGPGLIEVRGRAPAEPGTYGEDEFDYQGPLHKMTLTLPVASAEGAYEELIFREKNIPGGLVERQDGNLAFETHDPDGVRIKFLQLNGASD